MVAQHQDRFVAQVRHQPLLLAQVQRHPFVVVIGNPAVELHGNLIDRQQPALQRRHRTPGLGVGVQHALRIFTGAMNGAVDHETRRVDRVWRWLHSVAIEVDFHQVGRGDFVEHQPIGVDQKVMLRPRNAHRNVGEDQVGHAKVRNQAVAGRQFFTQALLGGAALRGQVAGDFIHCRGSPG
ncbi:hypothetical protein D3C81_1229380 [compost metagenome]